MLDVCCNDERSRCDCSDRPRTFAKLKEPSHGVDVGDPRVFVSNRRGKEFDETVSCLLAGGGDDAWQRNPEARLNPRFEMTIPSSNPFRPLSPYCVVQRPLYCSNLRRCASTKCLIGRNNFESFRDQLGRASFCRPSVSAAVPKTFTSPISRYNANPHWAVVLLRGQRWAAFCSFIFRSA